MAVPKLGQKRSDGKVYAGVHYGYQSPATFNKLKQEGETSKGSETRRNIQQAVRPAVQAAQNFQSKFRKATDKIPGIQALEKGVNKASDAAGKTPAARVAQGGSIVADKAARQLDIDPKVAATALLVGRVAVGSRGGGSSSARPTTRRLPTSARPSGTVRAGSAAPSRALTQARRGVIRPNTAQVARQASGPAHPVSDPRQLAPGNEVVKQAPRNRDAKKLLKQKAETQHVKAATEGYSGRVKSQPRGADTSNYLPNRGRVSPTDRGRAAQLRDTYDQRLAQALEGKRGPDRVAARNAFNRAETKRRNNIQRDARVEVQQFQRTQEAKAQKGTTPSSRESMAADMARRPRTQPIRNTSTTTTGTRRVAANPSSGVATTRTPSGESKTGIGSRSGIQSRDLSYTRNKGKPNETQVTRRATVRSSHDPSSPSRPRIKPVQGVAAQGTRPARTLNPATGRPDRLGVNGRAVTTKPSPNRTRGSNPAENFSAETRARTPLGRKPSKSTPTTNEEATSAFQKLTPGERQRVSPGLTVRSRQPDGRRSGGTGLRGTSTQDTRQRRTDRSGTRTIGRLGQTPTPKGGVGQPSSALDTPALRTRRAANATRAKDTGKPTPTPPKRTPAAVARLKQLSEQAKGLRGELRKATQLTKRQRTALQRKYDEIVDKLVKQDLTKDGRARIATNGEVRLQGSTKGNLFQTGVNSGTPDGRVPQIGNHNGTVSRQVAKRGRKPDARSPEANRAAKETMAAVRARVGIDRHLGRKPAKTTGVRKRLQSKLSGLLKRSRAR